MTHNEDEYDWHSLQQIGVQFQDYRTCDSAVEVCGVQSGHHVLDRQFNRPQEESEEAEVSEDKGTILDALKALELATQYVHHLIQRTVFLKCSTNLKMS